MADNSRWTGKHTFVMALTLAGVAVGLLLAALLLTAPDEPWRAWVSLVMLGVIELTDLLDGFLARRLKVTTEWGAMLDPYTDSFSRLVVFWSLAQAGFALAAVPLVMALRDVTVAYCRVMLAKSRMTVGARFSGKAKAVVQGVAAFVLAACPLYRGWLGEWPVPTVSWIVAVVTGLSALEYMRDAYQTAQRREAA